ncbi:zinc finger CCCH domain-containing protein 4 [Artemisia annua]|uniref:Zinc finger CCCH domain-containing protein 4 n=1 Tax=Artemisia annua TaxID=35608 RepID=A0A2U1L393_ARTAN|nr:zinc finger CCCH domain-containing protein 4 [Artemisia annua]
MAEPDTSSSSENFRNLPIMSLRSKIVEKIMENRVTLIVGETGCGMKTSNEFTLIAVFMKLWDRAMVDSVRHDF